MTYRYSMILAGVLCVAWCGSMCTSSAQDKVGKNGGQIHTLMTERRDTLRKRLEVLDAMYRMGKVDVERVASAHDDLLKAELELCSTKAEKLEVCKKRLDNLRALEKAVSASYESGIESIDKKLLVTAARLAAEITCLRLQEDSD